MLGGWVGEAVDDSVKHAQAGRFASARDAVQRQRLAGDAGEVVDVVRVEGAIGVSDPGHFALASAVIGCWDIDRRSDEVVLIELDHETSGDPLDKLG